MYEEGIRKQKKNKKTRLPALDILTNTVKKKPVFTFMFYKRLNHSFILLSEILKRLNRFVFAGTTRPNYN